MIDKKIGLPTASLSARTKRASKGASARVTHTAAQIARRALGDLDRLPDRASAGHGTATVPACEYPAIRQAPPHAIVARQHDITFYPGVYIFRCCDREAGVHEPQYDEPAPPYLLHPSFPPAPIP